MHSPQRALPRLRNILLRLLLLVVMLRGSMPLHGQPQRSSPGTGPESRAASALEAARADGPLALHAFLEQMPKGADLHMHLAGAVYTETYLRDAASPADLLCIDPVKLAFVQHSGTTRSLPPQPVCPAQTVSAASVFTDQKLYDGMVDSFSMRSFVPSPGVSGHDQFFSTFARFDGLDPVHTPQWLDEVATRAAAQNEQYLEVMITPPIGRIVALAAEMEWAPDAAPSADAGLAPAGTRAGMAALRDRLLASGLKEEIARERTQLDGYLASRRQLEHCGEASAMPGCSVEIRVLYQVLRAFAPQQVFAQTLAGFELAATDPNIAGINFVQPEDAYMAMHEYHRQMVMLNFLHATYPGVHIALHAGELAPGLVPPAGLRFHIREAVDLGHAERIGHGVDVMYETDPGLLLRELADRAVLVEINLTSNDVILGVTAPNHPLPQYLSAQVPVALSTDDEGVSRIDLTHEYTRAVLEYSLTYRDLKEMARNSLEHAFLPGESLWQRSSHFAHPVAVCAGATPGLASPRGACLTFLTTNPRAAQQWELEHRFQVFETTLPAPSRSTSRRARATLSRDEDRNGKP